MNAGHQPARFKNLHADYETGVPAALDKMTREKASETAQRQKPPGGEQAAESGITQFDDGHGRGPGPWSLLS
jgi:hypothetical protein